MDYLVGNILKGGYRALIRRTSGRMGHYFLAVITFGNKVGVKNKFC